VLVVAGAGANGEHLSSVEMFDPSTTTSTNVAPLPIAVMGHSATLLADGRVLIAGGIEQNGVRSARAFVWDRSGWTQAGSMSGGRADHSATRMRDGRVLIVGNREGHRHVGCRSARCLGERIEGDAAEIFDPRTGTFTLTASTRQPHFAGHQGVLLPSGDVAIFGMYEPAFESPRVVEVFRTNGAWEDFGDAALSGPMSATLLRDGSVLLTGARMEPNTRGLIRASRSFEVWRGARRSPRSSVVQREMLEG
jgi:hypothetical protein